MCCSIGTNLNPCFFFWRQKSAWINQKAYLHHRSLGHSSALLTTRLPTWICLYTHRTCEALSRRVWFLRRRVLDAVLWFDLPSLSSLRCVGLLPVGHFLRIGCSVWPFGGRLRTFHVQSAEACPTLQALLQYEQGASFRHLRLVARWKWRGGRKSCSSSLCKLSSLRASRRGFRLDHRMKGFAAFITLKLTNF